MSEFRDKADQIRQLGASIIGLSVESDRAHKAFADALGLDFPLVSDFNREVVGKYGIQYGPNEPFSGWHGMARRSVFVVRSDGTIHYKWITQDPLVPPPVDQVIDCLDELAQTLAR